MSEISYPIDDELMCLQAFAHFFVKPVNSRVANSALAAKRDEFLLIQGAFFSRCLLFFIFEGSFGFYTG